MACNIDSDNDAIDSYFMIESVMCILTMVQRRCNGVEVSLTQQHTTQWLLLCGYINGEVSLIGCCVGLAAIMARCPLPVFVQGAIRSATNTTAHEWCVADKHQALL